MLARIFIVIVNTGIWTASMATISLILVSITDSLFPSFGSVDLFNSALGLWIYKPLPSNRSALGNDLLEYFPCQLERAALHKRQTIRVGVILEYRPVPVHVWDPTKHDTRHFGSDGYLSGTMKASLMDINSFFRMIFMCSSSLYNTSQPNKCTGIRNLVVLSNQCQISAAVHPFVYLDSTGDVPPRNQIPSARVDNESTQVG